MKVVVAALALGLMGLGGDSSAQTMVLVRTTLPGCSSGACPAYVFSYDPDARALLRTTPVSNGQGAYVTPDGALLVASDPFAPRLFVLDRVSGADAAIPLAAVASSVVGNPTRVEVYLGDAAGGLALSPGGARRLSTPVCQNPSAASVSADGRRVVYRCVPGNGNPGYSAVIDTLSGALVHSFPSGSSPVLNEDGTALFQAEFVSPGSMLRRYVVDTGALSAETVLAPSALTVPMMAFDARSRRLFVPAVDAAFDAITLASQPMAPCGFNSVTSMVFERDRPRAFAAGARASSPFASDGVFCEIDTSTLTVTTSYRYGLPPSSAQTLALAESPAVPAPLSAQVAGASVRLSWAAGGPAAAISRYVLEVGSAPGLNDIFSGLDVGLQTSFAASGVPPGTYYVRVRAGNYSGLSAPSNEVAVVVP